MDGTHRQNGEKTSAPLRQHNKDVRTPKIGANLSKTDRGPEDRKKYLSKPNSSEMRYEVYDALPKDGFDGQITVSPFTDGVYDYSLKSSSWTKYNRKYQYLHQINRGSILFHELSENYYRTDENGCFQYTHEKAIEDEKKLPKGHPAKSESPGTYQIIENPQIVTD